MYVLSRAAVQKIVSSARKSETCPGAIDIHGFGANKMKSSPALVLILCFVVGLTSPHWLSAQQTVPEEETEAAEHMHDHLTYITTIKAFIIMGRLEGTRQPANWLATHETLPDLPTSYEPFVDFMRSSARQVEKSEDLETAATAVSLMAQNCGNCHRASHVDVEFGYDTLPAQWSDSETHMQRHQWAMDRLWEGLIGPSDAAWTRGTTMLAEEPLHAAELSASATAGEAHMLEDIAREVHELGEAGVGLTGLSDRSQLYGRILGLCADCHTRVGRGPGM
jgi:cytochrome c553